jgi:hypothetical protein
MESARSTIRTVTQKPCVDSFEFNVKADGNETSVQSIHTRAGRMVVPGVNSILRGAPPRCNGFESLYARRH